MKSEQDNNVFSKELLDAFLADSDSDNEELSPALTDKPQKSVELTLQHFDERVNEKVSDQLQTDETSTTAISDETNILGAIKSLVNIQSSTLLANPLNYYGYLQGKVIERIAASIINLLLDAYESEAQTAQNVFNQSLERFTKNREDLTFVENHVLNLIERLNQLKINGIKKRTKCNEIFIPFVAVLQPVCSIKRRFPRIANIDESERIKNARKEQLRAIRNLNLNATISDEIWEAKRKRHQKRIDSCFEVKAKRFLKDDKPLPEFDFAFEPEDSADKSSLETLDNASTILSNVDPRRARFATKVDITSNAGDIDDSFEELTREIVLNISQHSAPVVRPFNASGTIARRVISPSETARRRQLREQMSVHINAQPPTQSSSHAGAAGAKQQTIRQTRRFVRQEIRKVDRPPLIDSRRFSASDDKHDINKMKRFSVQKSTTIFYHGNQLAVPERRHSNGSSTDEEDNDNTEENDDYYNESDTNDESSDTDVRQLFSNENYDKPIGRVIIEPLIRELQSCLSSKVFFRPDTKKRVQYSEQGHSVFEYELDDTSNTLRSAIDKDSHTCLVKTTRFTKTTSLVLSPKNSNMTVLPHLDSPTPIFKRTDPRLLPLVTLQQYYAELRMFVDQLCAHANSKPTLSRWLICDTLLSELDDTVLKNAHITRIAFPRLPTWLISEGMAAYTKSFPMNITRIFVCCGYDIELLHSDDRAITTDFVHNLYKWMSLNVARRFIRPEGVEWRGNCHRSMPIFVFINIPEVGNFKRQFRVFNEKMKNFIDYMNSREEAITHGLIEIVDWAGLVKSCPDVRSMQTVEGRIALLIRELNKEHGLLIH